jgi:hypothetical protein
MSGSTGRTLYQLGFEISPIILTNGIADFWFGKMLPIVALTEGPNALVTALAGGNSFDLDKFFAHFTPLPGSTLLNYNIGSYPFANQTVAANAIIAEPLSISLRMNIPVNRRGGHTAKLATMVLLQALLQQHAEQGGTYAIVTPAAIYTGCILTKLVDVSSGANPIPQSAYQFDFTKPLTSMQGAQGAYSAFMDKQARQVYSVGSWSAVPGTGANSPPSALNTTGIAGANPIAGFLSNAASYLGF